MSIRLHIVTPCSRPWNIPAISQSLLQNQRPHPFEIRWHLCCQGPEPDPKGYRKSNEGIDFCPNGFLWFPSDDTLQPDTLFQRLGEVIQQYPHAGAIVFSQARKGVCPWTGGGWDNDEPGILRARPENMQRCRVDCTQVFFERTFLSEHRFDLSKYGPEADGGLISDLYLRRPEKFVLVDEVLTFFGSLDP